MDDIVSFEAELVFQLLCERGLSTPEICAATRHAFWQKPKSYDADLLRICDFVDRAKVGVTFVRVEIDGHVALRMEDR